MSNLSILRKREILFHTYPIDTDTGFSEIESVGKGFYLDRPGFWSDEDLEIDYLYKHYVEDPKSQYAYFPTNGITITGYTPLRLRTYYPMVHPNYNPKLDSPFKWTGHSELWNSHRRVVNKDFDSDGYNLVTNNCANATKEALEAIFGKLLDYTMFVTPGDVRDFALDNEGKSLDTLNREIIIPMNEERYKRFNSVLEKLKNK